MSSYKRKGSKPERVKGRLGQISTGYPGDVEELLSSKEQRHYSRALKEMHELVKLESLRMHLSRSDVDTETEQGEIGTHSSSNSADGGRVFNPS